jgi:hypothetical protein
MIDHVGFVVSDHARSKLLTPCFVPGGMPPRQRPRKRESAA